MNCSVSDAEPTAGWSKPLPKNGPPRVPYRARRASQRTAARCGGSSASTTVSAAASIRSSACARRSGVLRRYRIEPPVPAVGSASMPRHAGGAPTTVPCSVPRAVALMLWRCTWFHRPTICPGRAEHRQASGISPDGTRRSLRPASREAVDHTGPSSLTTPSSPDEQSLHGRVGREPLGSGWGQG